MTWPGSPVPQARFNVSVPAVMSAAYLATAEVLIILALAMPLAMFANARAGSILWDLGVVVVGDEDETQLHTRRRRGS